ncbi:MAG: hypothetical protein OHK0023_09110 [Anaerolineae bacterium]
MFKSRFARRLLRVVIVLAIIAVFVLYPVASLLAYNVLSTVSPKATPVTPNGVYEDVTYPSRGQDYMVRAFYLPAETPGRAIVFGHGWRGTRHSQELLQFLDALRQMGYTILVPDFADGRGETVGNGRIAMGYEERFDLLGGYDYLIERGFAPSQIGIMGGSMGATTVLLSAPLEPRIKAVWADSPYASVERVAGDQAQTFGFPRWIVPGGLLWGWLITGNKIWEVSAIDQGPALAANNQPVQLVHCDEDDFVFYQHSLDILAAYKAANVAVDLWTLACKKHGTSFAVGGTEYLQRVDAFFKAHLN